MPVLDDFSRFRKTPLVIVDGKETFDTWVIPSFLKQPLAGEFIGSLKVTSALEGRPDLIAHLVYNTPLLDWVIIAFNQPNDVLNWPRAGAFISYPVESIVIPALM